MISATFPEPLCDVIAQFRAMLDPAHPKDTVWLARGTAAPGAVDMVTSVAVPEGRLFTTDANKARYFLRYPSDETLAVILGYVEPKQEISSEPVVVRAIDGEGRVITEMACGLPNIGLALLALSGHGKAEVTTVANALLRRMRLS